MCTDRWILRMCTEVLFVICKTANNLDKDMLLAEKQ